MFAACIPAAVLSCPRQYFRFSAPAKSEIPRLVVLQIANSKLTKQTVVILLCKLVVPRRVVRRGRVFVLTQELVRGFENVKFCSKGGRSLRSRARIGRHRVGCGSRTCMSSLTEVRNRGRQTSFGGLRLTAETRRTRLPRITLKLNLSCPALANPSTSSTLGFRQHSPVHLAVVGTRGASLEPQLPPIFAAFALSTSARPRPLYRTSHLAQRPAHPAPPLPQNLSCLPVIVPVVCHP